MKYFYVFLLSSLFAASITAQPSITENLESAKSQLSSKYTLSTNSLLSFNNSNTSSFNRIKTTAFDILITAFEYAEDTELIRVKEDGVIIASMYPTLKTQLSLIKMAITDVDYLFGSTRLFQMTIILKL